jgi:hypothetical protein
MPKESELSPLTVKETMDELPTLCEAFVKFAESLELLPLDEVAQVADRGDAQDIILAASDFKAAMRQVLVRRHGLH